METMEFEMGGLEATVIEVPGIKEEIERIFANVAARIEGDGEPELERVEVWLPADLIESLRHRRGDPAEMSPAVMVEKTIEDVVREKETRALRKKIEAAEARVAEIEAMGNECTCARKVRRRKVWERIG